MRNNISIRSAGAFFVLLLFSFVGTFASAQTETATIRGRVTDSTGAIITGASLRLVSIDKGTETATKTDNSGIYVISGVQPGRYRMRVERDGFKIADIVGLIVNVQESLEENFRLEVGSASESVTVNGSGNNLNTTDPSVNTLVDRQFIENLPLNGRSFQSLLYLSPGVTFGVPSGGRDLNSQGDFAVNGQRADANYWMVDGVSANVGVNLNSPGSSIAGAIGGASVSGSTSAVVSVDALQEFRVETSGFSPEFGREPGGQVVIQTRSGSNQFHGTLFDYLRNTDLDANDWFNDHHRLPKPPEIQNDFGGVFGGPIFKDKTFFFFSYEGLRLTQPSTFIGTVPDLASRAAATDAMKPYFNAYPLPQPNAPEACVGCGYVAYSTTYSTPSSSDAYSLRLDHEIRRNVHAFARYSHAPSQTTQRGGGGDEVNDKTLFTSVTKTATVGVDWTVSPTMLDDFRYNYSVAGGRQFRFVDSFGGAVPFSDAGLFASGVSFQNGTFYLYPGVGTSMNEVAGSYAGPQIQHQNNVVNNFSWQKGKHDLKFGVDYRRLTPDISLGVTATAAIFASIPGMEAGQTSLAETENTPLMALTLQNLGTFAQDAWRVNDRLNLTYGLRLDVDYAPTDSIGSKMIAVPLTGFSFTNLSNLGIAPSGTPPYHTRYSNVAPRIGAAYRLSTDPNWGRVLRAGFGVFYGLASTEVLDNNWYNAYYPIGEDEIIRGGTFPFPPAQVQLPPLQVPNIGNGETLFGFDPNLNLPYALEWNVALQQALGSAQSLTMTYLGSADRRLLASEYVTNPNPNFASANVFANAASSNYQALQVEFQRRMAHGLQALISYNWSHAIDNDSYPVFQNGTFANINANRAASSNDIPQAFSAALSYNVPMLRSNLLSRAVTGGWALDNIVHVQSGYPIDVESPNLGNVLGRTAVVLRPDRVPNQPLYLTGSQYPGGKAINPAAFTNPPVDPVTGIPTRQGDFPRNGVRGLGWQQWDMTLRRDFTIDEDLKLQFRAEAFNVLNHPNFGPFNSTFQPGNVFFGQSTATLAGATGSDNFTTGSRLNALYAPGGPRGLELALKLLF